MAKEKKKTSGKKIALIIIVILLALVLAVMAGASIFINSMLGKIERVSETEPTLSDEEIEMILQETDVPIEEIEEEYTIEATEPAEAETVPETVPLIEEEDHIINVLLIGQDARPGQGRQRSDTMILCTINTEKKTLVMTSFLRDLYVDIPDWNGKSYDDNRLNVNYAFGGMGMLDECLKLNFGVVVDHNIAVNFSGFEKIVDIMGGVDIKLTSAEAAHLGLSSGWNHLDGHNALRYARIRKLDSDFGRTNRQRTVLNQLLEKVRNSSLKNLLRLTDTIFPLISTDMENSEIVDLVMEVFPILTELEVTTQYIPAKDAYQGKYIRGMAVLVADMEANRQILRDTIG